MNECITFEVRLGKGFREGLPMSRSKTIQGPYGLISVRPFLVGDAASSLAPCRMDLMDIGVNHTTHLRLS